MQNVGFNMGRMPKMITGLDESRLKRLDKLMEQAMQQHLPSPDLKLRAQICQDTLSKRAAEQEANR